MNRDAKIYSMAEELIRKHGWIQGGYGDKCGGFCAMGAVLETGGYFGGSELWNLAGGSVTNWNDEPGRTKEEVREFLLAAASLAMSEEAGQ